MKFVSFVLPFLAITLAQATAIADEIEFTGEAQFWKPNGESNWRVGSEYTTEASDLTEISVGAYVVTGNDPDGDLPSVTVEDIRVRVRHQADENTEIRAVVGTVEGEPTGGATVRFSTGTTRITVAGNSERLTNGAIAIDNKIRENRVEIGVRSDIDERNQVNFIARQNWMSDGNQIQEGTAEYTHRINQGLTVGGRVYYRDADQDLDNGYWDPQGLVDVTVPVRVTIPLGDNVGALVGVSPGVRFEDGKAVRVGALGGAGIRWEIDDRSQLEGGVYLGYGFTSRITYRREL